MPVTPSAWPLSLRAIVECIGFEVPNLKLRVDPRQRCLQVYADKQFRPPTNRPTPPYSRFSQCISRKGSVEQLDECMTEVQKSFASTLDRTGTSKRSSKMLSPQIN
jgi:hypothetical protein